MSSPDFDQNVQGKHRGGGPVIFSNMNGIEVLTVVARTNCLWTTQSSDQQDKFTYYVTLCDTIQEHT